MPAPPLAVLGVGLVSGVGLTAEESCAAIRCGINNFDETRFIGSDGELARRQRGRTGGAMAGHRQAREDGRPRNRRMPCHAADRGRTAIPVLVCIAEPERPGASKVCRVCCWMVSRRTLGLRLHPHSRVIEQGRVGGAVALLQARRMLAAGRYAARHRRRRRQLPGRRHARRL